MVDLISTSALAGQTFDPYAELNKGNGGGNYSGPTASPKYYDHLEASVKEGFFDLQKPVRAVDKDSKATKYSPFTVDTVFGITDAQGNDINHQFKGLRGIPVGYFIRGSLSTYDQANLKMVSHCSTVKAEINTGDKVVEVNGDHPVQTSNRIPYNFSKYQSPDDKKKGLPREYALGDGIQLYGKATDPAFVEATGRPELYSCADCVRAGHDIYTHQVNGQEVTSSCKVSGKLVFYVKEVAYKTKTLNWIPVADLGIPELGEGFIVVIPLKALELRSKPDHYALNKGDGLNVPVNAQKPHDWERSTWNSGLDGARLFNEDPDLGPIALIAIPTDVYVCKVESGKPTTSGNTVLLAPTPGVDDTTVAERHALLQEALNAYKRERGQAATQDDGLDFYTVDDLKQANVEAIHEVANLPDLDQLVKSQTPIFFDSLTK